LSSRRPGDPSAGETFDQKRGRIMKPIKKLIPPLIVASMAFALPAALEGAIKLGFQFSGRQEVVDKATRASQEGSLLGFNIGAFGLHGETDFGLEGGLSYTVRKADQTGSGVNNISDFSVYLGGRYYSNNPTFRLGNIDVRLTFSALGGFSWLWGGDFSTLPKFSPLLGGGLSFSPSGSPVDIMIEFVYRPVSLDMELEDFWGTLLATLEIKPSWCICMSLLLW